MKSALKKRKRISAGDRRRSIIETAMLEFARKGFHGTTTRDLARAAGVSEALLFQHFKNKEEIYEEVQFLCLEAEQAAGDTLSGLRPGTEALIFSIVILIYEVFCGFGGRAKNEMLRRLQAHSMLEDGKFARAFFEKHFIHWFPFVRKCFAAARVSGDLVDKEIPDL